jgi:hypothetical protein
VQGQRQPPRAAPRALVDITNQRRHTTMGYINDFRAKLTELIEDGRTEEAVKFAADKGFCRKFSFEVICSMLSPYDQQ